MIQTVTGLEKVCKLKSNKSEPQGHSRDVGWDYLWSVICQGLCKNFSYLKHKTKKIKLKTDPRATHNDIKFGLFGWIPLKLIAVKQISFTSDIINTT